MNVIALHESQGRRMQAILTVVNIRNEYGVLDNGKCVFLFVILYLPVFIFLCVGLTHSVGQRDKAPFVCMVVGSILISEVLWTPI